MLGGLGTFSAGIALLGLTFDSRMHINELYLFSGALLAVVLIIPATMHMIMPDTPAEVLITAIFLIAVPLAGLFVVPNYVDGLGVQGTLGELLGYSEALLWGLALFALLVILGYMVNNFIKKRHV